MNFSYLIWLLGIIVAVIIGLSVFHVYEVPFVMDQLRSIRGRDDKGAFRCARAGRGVEAFLARACAEALRTKMTA